MDRKILDAKKSYESLEIPEELNMMVEESIIRSKRRYRKNKKILWKKRVKVGIAASLLVASSFTIGINTSKSFAMKVNTVPVLSEIAKLVSFKAFDVKSKYIQAEVNIPSVENTGSKTLEKRINEEIHKKMEKHLKEAEKRAEEYYKAFIETGGTKEEFRKVQVKIDYKLKYQSGNMISFSVYHFESLASAYQKTYFYTISLDEGKKLTLSDILGTDYKAIVNKQIKDQISKAPEKYFKGEMGFQGISEDQKFYINKEGKLVIVFDKYEIAPGSAGEPEFEINQ